MPPDFDVIIVGSGPAGISAAFPLVQAGLHVMMVDGGKQSTVTLPTNEYLTSRATDPEQWKWMVGEDFYALRNRCAVSPKLRAPTNKYVFDEFESVNQVKANNFVTVGSLATGGLSNAWGCGVARLLENDMSKFPFDMSEINKSYEFVSKRIGISGCQDDDLSDYFNVDLWAHKPIQMDKLHDYIYTRYLQRRSRCVSQGFRLGHSRIAVLSEDIAGRDACNISGNCLWGCYRKALYSAADELALLLKNENFKHKSGFVVDKIRRDNNVCAIDGYDYKNRKHYSITAKRVFLASGTLATTRFALEMLKNRGEVSLLSCPTAAFLLWIPRLLGAKRLPAFGLGQLSFTSQLTNSVTAFGSTYSTTGIPTSEFIRYLPLKKRFGIDFLRGFLSSCVVGNVFLPGHLSSTKVTLKDTNTLFINGGFKDEVPSLMSEVESKLRKSYWKLGVVLLPKSFTVGEPGGDIHYAGTFPMHENSSKPNHTNPLGELHGFDGVHIVDGACLPSLSEKSHTLTIMANADRIAREIVEILA